MNTSNQAQAITPETVFSVRTAANARISPDGQKIAFQVGEWLPGEDKYRKRLWITDTRGGEAEPLTRGTRQDGSAAWSPDGHTLAFASKVEGEKGSNHFQLFVKDVQTGAEQQVCTLPNGISNVSWSPDGKRIAFCSTEGEAPLQDPQVQYNGMGRHTRLWTVRRDYDIAEPVTPNGLTVWQYTWSPDSSRFAVYYTTGPDETDWYRGQIGLVAAHGGAIHQISQLKRQAFALTWSPDATRLAYVSGEWSDPDRGGGDIYVHSLADGQTRNLTPKIEWSPSWLQWHPDNRQILCAGWHGLSTRIALLDEPTGNLTTISDNFLLGDRGWAHFSAASDLSQIAVTHSEQHPYDIWSGEITYNDNQPATITWQRHTQLNPLTEETLAMATTERIHYKSVDGWTIEALITWPKKSTTATPPPLIVNVHGGPSGAWQDDWDFYRTQTLAAAGYAVLCPNIRGSMGRGVAFADAVIGDMGGKDLQDVLKGVDYLVERQLVDGERVGIMGWSYGGFMTAWAVTQTNRFKAAIMGAGISDFHSFHAQTNIQDWDMRFLGTINQPANPLADITTYRDHSPLTYASRATTPTLIVHGEKDLCVPVNQAWAFYRALQEQGIPVELITYPREGHGLTERKHTLDYAQRTLNWFNRFLC